MRGVRFFLGAKKYRNPVPSPLSASLLAQRLPFSGRIFSSSCASLASLNARLFLPAFASHRAAFPHPNPHPRGSGQRSWTQGWRSQTGGGKMQKRTEESLLSSGRFKFFPAAGHARSQLFCPPIPPNQLSRRKQVLCFFLDARKKRSPRILHPSLLPRPKSSALLQGWRRALLYCFLFMHIRKARAAVYGVCRPMCATRYSARAHRSIGARPSRTTPQRCASTQISRSITVLARPRPGRG